MYAWGHGTGPGDLDCLSEDIHACFAQARTWMAEAHNIQLLSLYENRIRRNLEKNEKQLDAMQAERKLAYNEALEEAKLLTQLALMRNQPYEPNAEIKTTNGFVFSGAEIHAIVRRELRLQEAKFYKNNGWDRRESFAKPNFRIPQAA